jgi:hypothetical protein
MMKIKNRRELLGQVYRSTNAAKSIKEQYSINLKSAHRLVLICDTKDGIVSV